MASTIEGLNARGHQVTVVAPDAPGRSLAASFARSVVSGRPLSVERHARPRIAATVRALIREERFDVVHVEQPQALLQALPALEKRLPVVLRSQNVESELWNMLAVVRPAWRLLAKREAHRLAHWEAESAARVTMTLALTANDAAMLQRMAPGSCVRVVRMPMPPELPASARVLAGTPAVVLLASGGWFPNRDGAAWFLRHIWPGVARQLPAARLHVFGNSGAGAPTRVEFHQAPDDSRDAFARGSILVVPLRIASGARVRILEAWARGVPVVATPAAASGLDVPEGTGLLVARTADEFAAAFTALANSGARATQLVEEGRAALRQWHDPRQIALELESAYVEVIGVSAGRTD